MKTSLRLNVVGVTDVGLVREHNEDSIGWADDMNLAILADGMGGHKAGDVASKMAVEGLLKEFSSLSTLSGDETSILGQLIDGVNNDIYRMAQDNSDCEKMGTTLAMICLHGELAIISHAGDSRVYRYREGQLSQLTEDHSLVRQLIKDGAMNADDANNSHYKNVITRALGIRIGCEAEINLFSTQLGDLFLLCSDGLNNMVSDEEITKTLFEYKDEWARAAQALVDKANIAGGEDNISVVLAVVKTAYNPAEGKSQVFQE